ncbi:MAG TPA: J domain-containing protein [Sphingomicrobium sp.]|nr:J domain-containing protein [Sphingomicrobium sp.]
MARPTRSDDWGFPRWRPYGAKGRAAARVRLCDREGCNEPGDRPAPKAPNSRERWMFCEAHAAEYNKNWNYFAGLTAEEAAKRAAEEESGASAYRKSAHYSWSGPGDGSRSRDEMRALSVLGLESDAEFKQVRTAYRQLAKEHHPDLKQGDKEAEQRFREIQAAYDVLKRAEERKTGAKL